MKRHFSVLSALLIAGCSEATSPQDDPGTPDDEGGVDLGDTGTSLAVTVPAKGRVFIKLKTPAVVAPPDNGAASTDWDLAFEAFDVFTNSGPSGPGNGGGFGPLPVSMFLADTAPEVPFITKDETGGAFRNWYAYDGGTHALWSRYHVYGVRAGDRLWKVQILNYYGEQMGAPTSALYQLRYAEVSGGNTGPMKLLTDVDGTAGGASAPDDAPSTCVDFGTGERILLTPDEARASKAWHLCFRRDAISVNGELGGPGGVTAVDLDSAGTDSETLEQVTAKTASSEELRFNAVGLAELTAPKLVYRGDRVVSTFSDGWLEPGSKPPVPVPAAWLAVAADEASRFLVVFERLENPTETSPGTVTLRIKPTK